MVVCQFFLRGACKFGNNCRNEHTAQGSSGFGGNRSTFGQQNDKYHFNSNPKSSLFRSNKTGTNATADQDAILQLVRKELQEWDVNKVWPLSCYAAQKENGCLTGLTDTSPEELRMEFYRCKAANTPQPYLEGVTALSNQTMSRRNQLKSCNNQQLANEIKAAFGQASTTNSTSQLSSNSSSTGLFGSSTQNKTGLFGSSSTGGFGSGQSGGLFSSSNQSSSSSAGLFGSSSTSQSSGLFASKPNPFTNNTAGGGLFGSNQTQSGSNSGGLFGSNQTQTGSNSGGLFSGNQTQNNTGGGLFSGNSNASTFSLKPASGFAPVSNPFGQQTSSSGTIQNSSMSGGLFGSNQSGNSGGGLFGSSQSNTGGGGLFGSKQNNSSSGGLFGSSQNQGNANTGGLFSSQTSSSGGGALFGAPQSSNSTSGGMFSSFQNTAAAGGGGSGLFGSSQQNQVSSGAAAVNPFLSQAGQSRQKQDDAKYDQLKQQQPTSSTTSEVKLPPVTPEDMAQFQADTFDIGRIPTCPPPIELCT